MKRDYPNFYENLKEAQDRLLGTVVLYGGLPVHVFAITDHKNDGVFRAWLAPIGDEQKDETVKKFYRVVNSSGAEWSGLGADLDKLLEETPDCLVMRKHLSSPKFNKFRPFPLGMCNVGTQCFYVERQPIRPMMHQGLVRYALHETLITAGSRQDNPAKALERVDVYSQGFRDCILADHHQAADVLKALMDPKIANDAHAFHREFAFVRGPVGMVFLAYRTEVIGCLPNHDLSLVALGREFSHCREAVTELEIFERI
jgi:hypothetical protein